MSASQYRSVAMFNRLNGITSRDSIENILSQAIDDGFNEIAARCKSILMKKPNAKSFDLLPPKPLSQNVPNNFAQLNGVDYVDENDIDTDLGDLGKAGSDKVYQIITDKIIEMIESDKNLKWRKMWGNAGEKYNMPPTNGASLKPYTGSNVILLALQANINDFGNPYWLTWNQIKAAKGKLAEDQGTKFSLITAVSIRYFEADTRTQITRKEYNQKFAQDPNSVYDVPSFRYVRVYNGDQIEGIDWSAKPYFLKPTKRGNAEKIDRAEQIIEGYKGKPEIRQIPGNEDAVYKPQDDIIEVPTIDDFENEQEYYATVFHELIHSTGHEKRLNRFAEYKGKDDQASYTFEELVAELGACFLCADAGILYHTINNAAAYLKGYKERLVKMMKEDNKFIFRASSEAQKATTYIHPNYGKMDIKPGAGEKEDKAKVRARLRLAKAKLKLLQK